MAGPKSSFVECVGSAGDVVEVTPWGPFLDMEAGDHRRLSPVSRTKGDTAIVASIGSALRRAKAEGGREEAARLANKILGVLQAHGQH